MFFALLVLCTAGFVSVHNTVNADKAAVSIEETLIYGDKSAADGILIDFLNHYKMHMHWSTQYLPGTEPTVYSSFRFTPSEKRRSEPGDPRHISFYADSYNFGMSTSSSFDLWDENEMRGQGALFRDVAERTPNGAERTEFLDVRDYYTYVPTDFSINFDGFHYTKYPQSHLPADYAKYASLDEALPKFLKIPIPEEATVEVSVTKDNMGSVKRLSIAFVSENGFAMRICPVRSDDAIYFTFNSLAGDGTPIDTSEMAEGYGIYRIPIMHYGEGSGWAALGNEMKNVFPLDPSINVKNMYITKDGTTIMLMTAEENSFFITVIDIASMKVIQKFKVCNFATGYVQLFQYDNFMLFNVDDSKLVVVETADGELMKVAAVIDKNNEVTKNKDFSLGYSTVGADWNGEKLLITVFSRNVSAVESPEFLLYVYDKEKPIFAASYKTSLDNCDYNYPTDIRGSFLKK